MSKYFKIFLFFISIPASICQGSNDNYPRNKNLDILQYVFMVELNDSTDRIEGRTSIRFTLHQPADSINLDLAAAGTDGKGMTVTGVSCGAGDLDWRHTGETLTVFMNRNGSPVSEISISYYGVPADGLIISKNKFGNRVFFSDHWPDRAHEYLPCIDHPFDKAAVDFILRAPLKYSVIANGVPLGEQVNGQNLKTTRWSENIPLPVKVMAFGVAEFAVQESGIVDGIPVSSWVFPENRAAGFNDYFVAPRPLAWYIDLIGEYPYKKLANVQSKTIFGGLENAEAIFYAERSVTGLGAAEGLIAHEIAHQWFGNSVTENDWHHLWLSEGFATYLTSMYFQDTRGEEFFRADIDSSRARIVRYYSRSRKPVIDTSETDLMELLNTNTYQKGAWFLHMLRNMIGDEQFRKGLGLFYERNRNKNVMTDDFLNVMEEVSGLQLDGFFRQWLWTEGHPRLCIKTLKGKRKSTEILIEQMQENLFEFSIQLKIINQAGEEIIEIPVKDKITKYALKGKVRSFVPDPEIKLLFQLVE